MSTPEERAADVASARETVANLSSDDLFKGAMTEETPSPQPSEPTPPAPTEQPRDERGRWATKPEELAPQAPAAATQQPPVSPQAPPQQPTDADGGPVPSWRHRELREQRDAVETRNRQLEAYLIDQSRQMQQLQSMVRQQQQPKEPLQVPDVISDPSAYHQHMMSTFEDRLRNQEANFSFRLAHQVHGEMFEHAYANMIGRAERGDPSVVQAVMRSPDPGAAMCNWWRREQNHQRVGDDPDKWFDAQLDERLKDQKYAGSVMEKIRGSVPANGNGSAPNVQIPPSLNRMAAAAQTVPVEGDMSDASLWHHAFRAKEPPLRQSRKSPAAGGFFCGGDGQEQDLWLSPPLRPTTS